MSSAKRSQSAVTPSADAGGKDIMNDPRVLRHELRHVKVRLRESRAQIDEMAENSAENLRLLEQEKVYGKRMDEAWTHMEEGLKALAGSIGQEAAAASAAAAAAGPSAAAAAAATLSSAANPVLRMLATRWSALTGRDAPRSLTAASSSSSSAASASAADDSRMDEGKDDELGDEDEEEEGEGGAGKLARMRTSEKLRLDEALQTTLQQRTAFVTTLLASLVKHLAPAVAASSSAAVSAPVPPSDPAAQLLSLQSERLSLGTRLHSLENEVVLLTSTLSQRDARYEELMEKNRLLSRRIERMHVDAEKGAAAMAREKAYAEAGGAAAAAPVAAAPSAPRGAMPLSESIPLESVPDTRPMSPASLASTSAVPAAAPGAALSGKYTDADFAKLREELLDSRKLCKSRQDDLSALRQENGALQLAVQKARMDALNDASAVRETPVFKSLDRYAKTKSEELKRIQISLETKSAELAEAVAVVERERSEQAAQIAHAQARFEAECARFSQTITQQQAQIQSLQSQLTEQSLALPLHPDFAFYQQLRQELLPGLEEAVKAQAVQLAQITEERTLASQSAGGGSGEAAIAANMGRVWRSWMESERKLTSERDALKDEIATLRNQPSAPVATASLQSELSALRVQLGAATKELATLQSQLSEWQSGANELSACQSALAAAMEMQSELGEQLDQVSQEVETTTAASAKHAQGLADNVKQLDKIRQQRQLTIQSEQKALTQVTLMRTKLEATEAAQQPLQRAVKDAKALGEAHAREEQRYRESLAAVQSELSAARSAAQGARDAAAEVQGKLSALEREHDKCTAHIKEMKQRQIESDSATHRSEEARRLLKSRIHRLQETAGNASGGASSSSSRKGSSSSAASPDAELIHSLRLRVNCKVCETNQKDCVITKCMHPFCQSCVKKNLDSRLRKCPTCGLKFGENDVRPLFL